MFILLLALGYWFVVDADHQNLCKDRIGVQSQFCKPPDVPPFDGQTLNAGLGILAPFMVVDHETLRKQREAEERRIRAFLWGDQP